MKVVLLLPLVVVVLVPLILFLFQERMIYEPRRYEPAYLDSMPPGLTPIAYRTSQGAQTAHYLGPRSGTDGPRRVWVVMSGNATLSLTLMGFALAVPASPDGFLFVDYPGYGLNEGSPSPPSILEGTEAALAALASRLGIDPTGLEGRIDAIGYSLGAATVLQMAVHHDVGTLVLVAPFTSMLDMAARRVGRPLCYLLRHRYDNRRRLVELVSRSPAPRVVIFHGTADRLVPVEMGRELAALGGDTVEYVEVPGRDHGDIVDEAVAYFGRLAAGGSGMPIE